jgi:hypothetical protein
MSFQPIIATERAHEINGVPGRYFGATVRPDEKPDCFCHQRWASNSRPISGYGPGGQMSVEIRYDDNCRNGHNSFAITAEVVTAESKRRHDIAAGGCLHDDIAKVFPELAPLIRWHLMGADGPMHYEANTLYLANDRDYNGLRAGERRQIRNGKTNQLCWKLDKASDWPTYVDSDTQPAAPAMRYVPWERIGEGKARELDRARSAAVWPDATDEQLCADPEELRAVLRARLPGLVAEFRADVERIGFLWTPADAAVSAE